MDGQTSSFIYPHAPCHGDCSVQKIAINANMQEFATRAGYIAAFHSAGKLSTPDALAEIERLAAQLKDSAASLNFQGGCG
jgi:hypothetical protein